MPYLGQFWADLLQIRNLNSFQGSYVLEILPPPPKKNVLILDTLIGRERPLVIGFEAGVRQEKNKEY